MTVSREKSSLRSCPAFKGLGRQNSRDTRFPVSRDAWTQAADTSSWISAEQQDAATAEHPEDIQCQNRRSKVN